MPRFGGVCSSDTETKHPNLATEVVRAMLVRLPGMRQIFVEGAQHPSLDRLRADVATFLDLPDDVRTALRRIKPQFFTGGAAIALLFSEIHERPFPSNDFANIFGRVYTFANNYPNIRHSGNAGCACRELRKEDTLLAALLFVGLYGCLHDVVGEG
jgi:hypothetical protein